MSAAGTSRERANASSHQAILVSVGEAAALLASFATRVGISILAGLVKRL